MDLFAATRQGIFLSRDNGGTWTRTHMDLHDVQTMAATDRDLFVDTFRHLFRSSDRGDTWDQIDSGLAPTPISPPSILCLAVGGGFLYAGVSQAGVWRRSLSGLSEVSTAILPLRASGARAGRPHGEYRGAPGFLPGTAGMLRMAPATGIDMNGRSCALPIRSLLPE
jgi:hypothetical protein